MYELTRLEWFIKTNQSEPLLGFNDGLVASKLIAKVLEDNQEDDDGVISILDEIKDQVRQGSLNAIIISTKKSLKTLNVNPYATLEELAVTNDLDFRK